MTSQIHPCEDNSDVISLNPVRGLFLKPIARINVSVHYPELKQSLTTGGKNISSWEIMERIKALVAPEKFISLKVLKNTLEFVRFEGDLENRNVLKNICLRLDGKTLKVTGFKELLKIRTGEAKVNFPSKYDWDTFFRDAKNMNEMKAGERPDTIYFQNLPRKWFSDDRKSEKPLPSEKIFRKIWEAYGEVRCVDIPCSDPYRLHMAKSVGGIQTFTFSNDNVFEAYVQFREYMSFVKAMDALRGCFLFYQDAGKFWVANLKVDFDKSKHLSEESIRRRKAERDRLSEKDKQKREKDKFNKIGAEITAKRQNDEEIKETDKKLAKIEFKIAMEERKYLVARRKLEAIRLMDYLFESVKKRVQAVKDEQKNLKRKTKDKNKKIEKVMKKYSHHEDHDNTPPKRRKEGSDYAEKEKSRKQSDIKSRETRDSNSEVSDTDSESNRRTEQPERVRQDQDYNRTQEESRGGELLKERRPSGGQGYSSRYLGDWEVKAKSQLGSEVKVSSNYVPVGHNHRGFYRGRGRGRGRGFFRGRGRGGPYQYNHQDQFPHNHHPDQFPPNHHQNQFPPNHHQNQFPPNHQYRRHPHDQPFNDGPPPPRNETVVHHDYSYLEELDRAYEKYFTSITQRHSGDNHKSADSASRK